MNNTIQKLEKFNMLKTEEYNKLNTAIRDGELNGWHELYKSQIVNLHRINCLVRAMWVELPANNDRFFDMKKLVEMINAYFEIEEPYKPANKIAYGWNFALQKGSEAFRPYLYGCIRNYLNKNGVEFKTLELQIICVLKDVVKSNGEEWEEVNPF